MTGKEQGIGLGLAVAKRAADSHGGRLTWERRDGRGEVEGQTQIAGEAVESAKRQHA